MNVSQQVLLEYVVNILGKSEYEDVLQANNLPSSRTPRGHQAPAAFIIMASGLDKVTSLLQLFKTFIKILLKCLQF